MAAGEAFAGTHLESKSDSKSAQADNADGRAKGGAADASDDEAPLAPLTRRTHSPQTGAVLPPGKLMIQGIIKAPPAPVPVEGEEETGDEETNTVPVPKTGTYDGEDSVALANMIIRHLEQVNA